MIILSQEKDFGPNVIYCVCTDTIFGITILIEILIEILTCLSVEGYV